jgi:hypothetical protein
VCVHSAQRRKETDTHQCAHNTHSAPARTQREEKKVATATATHHQHVASTRAFQQHQ